MKENSSAGVSQGVSSYREQSFANVGRRDQVADIPEPGLCGSDGHFLVVSWPGR